MWVLDLSILRHFEKQSKKATFEVRNGSRKITYKKGMPFTNM